MLLSQFSWINNSNIILGAVGPTLKLPFEPLLFVSSYYGSCSLVIIFGRFIIPLKFKLVLSSGPELVAIVNLRLYKSLLSIDLGQ